MTKRIKSGTRALIVRVLAAVAAIFAIASPQKSNALTVRDSTSLTIEERVNRIRESIPPPPELCSPDGDEPPPPARTAQWRNWPNWNNWRNWRNWNNWPNWGNY